MWVSFRSPSWKKAVVAREEKYKKELDTTAENGATFSYFSKSVNSEYEELRLDSVVSIF